MESTIESPTVSTIGEKLDPAVQIGDAGSYDPKMVLHLPQSTYTSGEVARLLGIPVRTMRRFLAIGRIVGEKNPVTGTWQIKRDDVVRFATENGYVVDSEPDRLSFLLMHHDRKLLFRLEDMLKSVFHSFKIETAENPCNGLISMGSHPPDVVFLSPHMPIVRGREILGSIRNNQKTKHIKVVGVGPWIDELSELTSLGADAMLETPFTAGEFLGVLEKILPEGFLPKESNADFQDVSLT